MSIRTLVPVAALMLCMLVGAEETRADVDSLPDLYIDLDFFLGIRDPIHDTDEVDAVVILAANTLTGQSFTGAEAVSGATAPMAFALYTSSTPGPGKAQWEDSRIVPYGADGHVHVILGTGKPIPGSVFGPRMTLYLEIKINGDPMDTRIPLFSPGPALLLEPVGGTGASFSPGVFVDHRLPVILSARPASGGAAVFGPGPRAGRVIIFEPASTTGTQWTTGRQVELTERLAAQAKIIRELRAQLGQLKPLMPSDEQ